MIFGERIRLRAIETDDLPRFVRWLNDPEVIRGLTIRIPMSNADEQDWYEETRKGRPETRPLSIDVLEDGQWVHIGSCGFFGFDSFSHSAELGIAIGHKSYWRRGLGRDATRTLLGHGFETLNLHRIFLRVYEFNQGAIDLYRQLGFVEEGRLREDSYREGRYWDTILMGLLRAEWDASQQDEG